MRTTGTQHPRLFEYNFLHEGYFIRNGVTPTAQELGFLVLFGMRCWGNAAFLANVDPAFISP